MFWGLVLGLLGFFLKKHPSTRSNKGHRKVTGFDCVNVAYVGQRMSKLHSQWKTELQDMDRQNTAASLLVFCSQF